MASTQYKEDEYVRCPFYTKESPIEIKCTGYYGMHSVEVFRDKKQKAEHKYDFCCGNYTACMLYQVREELHRGDL